MSDTIYIVGAGAVGKALAVSLTLDGKKVIILRGRIDDGSSSDEKINVLYNNETELEAIVKITTLSSFSTLDGIVILTNKSFGNQDISQKLIAKAKNNPIVLLQNGLGIEQPFLVAGFMEIFRCVLFMTSQNINNNEISYRPVAVSPIGTIKCLNTSLQDVVDAINSPHFKFKAEDDIQKIIWEKAIANSVFNSICPLLEIDNGIFHREGAVFELAKRVISECQRIAAIKGIELNTEEIEKRVLLISSKSDGQFISTLQDIKNGRKTEIETFNLEFARIAAELGEENQITETRLLGELTRMKSNLTLGKRSE